MMIDMQTLGGSSAEAAAVNNANQIAGGSSVDGAWHAFVSAPPASNFSQTMTFGALGNKTLGDPDFAVSATASSGLPVSFGATGSCQVTGSTVHITGGGTCTITASQGGNSIFAPATSVEQSFSIDGSAGPVPQTICVRADSQQGRERSRLHGQRDGDLGPAGDVRGVRRLHDRRDDGPSHWRGELPRHRLAGG